MEIRFIPSKYIPLQSGNITLMRNCILADNQELTGFALQSMLHGDDGYTLSRAADKAELILLLKKLDDAVVILDFRLFDFADEEQLLIVGERFPLVSWVLLSDDLTAKSLRKVVYSSHSFSVVFKDEPIKEIEDAILSASQRKRFISHRAIDMILSNQHEETPEVLTATEIEIVKCIALGKTTKVIAGERFSSIHTINTHRKNIFRKLGINTAHEAVKYALRSGLIDSSEFYI